MSRALAAAVLALALALVGAGSASGASGPVFAVVPTTAAPALPSAAVPNAPGSVALPIAFTAPPLYQETRGIGELHALWRRAGSAYGIPWNVLAAINKIESNFGRNMGPSSAGAVGWMQFMPSTWLRWGTDATADGIADPWNPEDAVYSAARYLAAAGAREDLYRGIFAYNHADWYVRDVLDLAAVYGTGGEVVTFNLDRLQVQLDKARKEVSRANRSLLRALRAASSARRNERALLRQASAARLISNRLGLERQAFQAGLRADGAGDVVRKRREALREATAALDAARAGAATAAMAPGSGALFGTPIEAAGYVFPVGGGPGQVSVGHYHHDYPAADIAAPPGAPLYALVDGVVEDAWPVGAGGCGVGFKLLAGDGRTWTYCHLSFLEPTVFAGAFLPAGAPVGLVGSTGHSTGPHLHLQAGPVLTYPQEEPWFRLFAGTAFTWQDEVQQPAAPVFEVVEEPVFQVVEVESTSPEVVEFTLNS